jgi:putative transcriptional regulator
MSTKKKRTTKSRSAGSEVIEGLSEFRDALEEGVPLEERFTVRTVKLDLDPHVYGPGLVRETRSILMMSQTIFARFLGVDPRTVQSWEQGLRRPSPIARRFMDEIRRNPKYWIRRIREEVRARMSG